MKQVIFFKGSECAPCTMFEPIFDKIIEETNFKGTVVKAVNNVQWMAEYGLRQVPAVVLLVNDEKPMIYVGKDLKAAPLKEVLAALA